VIPPVGMFFTKWRSQLSANLPTADRLTPDFWDRLYIQKLQRALLNSILKNALLQQRADLICKTVKFLALII